MPNTIIRIGTRSSRLALAQAKGVRRSLSRLHPGLLFRLVKIRTAGDEFKSVEIFKNSGIGVFTKAIEKKLLQGEIDFAVHSLKDLPTTLSNGLVLAAIPKRLTTRDALVSSKRYSFKNLPRGARIGTGSERRAAQIRLARPDAEVIAIRGNLDTRVAMALKTGKLDAVVLAEAGLRRIQGYARFRRYIPEKTMLPAVGQGTIGIQCRSDDRRARRLAWPLHDKATALLVEAERAFLRALGGGCRVPVGVTSQLSGNILHFTGAVFSTRSPEEIRGSFSVRAVHGKKSAGNLARRLLHKGARRLLAEARA